MNESLGSHVEHIVPEALGCPNDFVLTNEVICRSCNNGLGHIDQAVIDDFDFLSFMAGIPRKGGKPPIIKSRGNVVGTVGPKGREISFNMENHPVKDHTGAQLAGFRNRERDIKAHFSHSGKIAQTNFSIEFGRKKKFHRGIYKIAFSALTHFAGASEAKKKKYNIIRRYVRKGAGKRHIILGDSGKFRYQHAFKAPWVSESGDYAMQFILCGVTFIVDLSEDEDYPRLKAAAMQIFKGNQWTYLPK
ncbi:hypothetical protein [Nitrosococcus oceani]|uniref:hypothetical protein n=1 Tax=Nitrosococcus oceani TaxID=1229 RepID=UPI0018CCC8EB|nr:hypothetical protein [Nitrosococcus oceani]